MKKIIALAIAIVMMAALAVPAFAAPTVLTNNPGTGNMTVTYAVTGEYTVTIPDAAVVDSDDVTVSVAAGALLASGTQIKVTVSPSTGNAWTLVNSADEEDTLAYTIKNGENAIAVGGTVLTHAAGKTAATEVALSFDLVNAATKAGTYSQTITFTVAVEDIPTES